MLIKTNMLTILKEYLSDTEAMIKVMWNLCSLFGFGLSYTTFEYSNLNLNSKTLKPDGNIEVTVEVKNTGNLEGKEIVQLYIGDKHSSLPRPVKELKHFAKVDIKPGESKKVVFKITNEDLIYFNQGKGGWISESGEFEVLIGSSSKDIKLKDKIILE